MPEVVEDADTLVGNARLKARALVAATGMAAVADDTGLEVDALGGAPGVFSARYAGEDATYADNVAKLLHELRGLDDGGGAAARRLPDGGVGRLPRRLGGLGRGRVAGDHRRRSLGAPTASATTRVFVPDGADGRTFAEMRPEEKDAVSHRGRAFRALAAELARRAKLA